MKTFQEISKTVNSGKSLSVEESCNQLLALGLGVVLSKYKGYKDVKPAGQRYVTSRKEVTYWQVKVTGQNVSENFNSELHTHAAYSLSSFVYNQLRKKNGY